MEKVYPTVHKSNAFIGNYLRLIILLQNGEKARISSECVDYFYYMAKRTGTLWEHDDSYASLNHGFASYVANLLIEYLIGYRGRKGNTLIFTDTAVKTDCSLRLPLGNGFLEFTRTDGKETLSYPDGYQIQTEN
jgi:alpha-L-rhamnosidase